MPRKSKASSAGGDAPENTRIAIVSSDKCKPKKCKQECKKSCPVVRRGKLCIEVKSTSKLAFISEELCIGCGICVKKCPFGAINIINLPKSLNDQTTHRYGPNSFKLHRLPMPRPNEVLGLVGTNGIGKSTALKILAGKLKPNLGQFDAPPDWEDILKHFRGSELQNYFTKILMDDLKAVIKPQYVDHIPKAVKGQVGKLLKSRDSRKVSKYMAQDLDLTHVLEREVIDLSGGELQRFAIAVVAVQKADVYMFDEPSSYLDVRQRMKAAQTIRALVDLQAAAARRMLQDSREEAKVAKAAKDTAAAAAAASSGGAGGGAGASAGASSAAAAAPATAAAGASAAAAAGGKKGKKGKKGAKGAKGAKAGDAKVVPAPGGGGGDAAVAPAGAGGAGGGAGAAVDTDSDDDDASGAGSGSDDSDASSDDSDDSDSDASGDEDAVAAVKSHSRQSYVVVVEHDLAVLDYLSDYICCLYGKPGGYGVVTMPFSVRDGINVFLAGFVPTENMRFRDEELTFKVAENVEEERGDATKHASYTYPALKKTLRSKSKGSKFKLKVEAGSFNNSQIIVMLGENGTGKTTFIRMLAGRLKPDPPKGSKEPPKIDGFSISYKPQKISPSASISVRALLYKKIRDAYAHPQFQTDVVRPMLIEEIIDQDVKNLSGGELQRLAITVALGTPSDVYLIDEPSAYLDSEQRIVAAKVIKRFILHAKKTAFIVEHDFIMATYLADRVIVYSGKPGVTATAHTPQSLLSGMNQFLRQIGITFRRDPTNFRPRINKMNSVKDQEQKRAGTFFYLDD